MPRSTRATRGSLSGALPSIGSMVQAIGYPMGGEQVSITEGVVSRIEYAEYNMEAQGLRIQVDAALNQGNSGGPVILDGAVVGVVFSGIEYAENIGYVIPAEEVRLFLEDIGDGSYDGQPRLMRRAVPDMREPRAARFPRAEREQTGLVHRPGRGYRSPAPGRGMCSIESAPTTSTTRGS